MVRVLTIILVSADTKMYQLKQQHKQKKDSNFLKGVDISSVPMMVDNNIQIMDREGHVCRVFDFLKLNNVKFSPSAHME